MKILIVEDEIAIVEYLREILEESFPTAKTVNAANGAEALHLCSQQKFDVICTDHRMPVMTGLEFVEFVRRESGPNQQTGIIFISGYIDDCRMKAEILDDVYFINKPPQLENLLRMVSIAAKAPLKRQKAQ